MFKIREITIKNFRVIRNLVWHPEEGINCLIGAGDSGKSTILNAIDLALGFRGGFTFTDSDFYCIDVENPIEIFVSIGALGNELKNIEIYGDFLRGFNLETKETTDEPTKDNDDILTIKLQINSDLDPKWSLYSDRAISNNIEKNLIWRHKELIAPLKLGMLAGNHFSWNRNSLLNKLTDSEIDISGGLTAVTRGARSAFDKSDDANLSALLEEIKKAAQNMGVLINDVKPLLDVKSISLNSGAIGLHDENNTPLRNLGLGSSRLLTCALQRKSKHSTLLLVDELEYGLEPYRITRLLNELGSKDSLKSQQCFITTHSPYVVVELQAEQLFILKKSELGHAAIPLGGSDIEQATLRTCPSAFFAKKVIVCEGKSEIGFLRGYDLYWKGFENGVSLNEYGVCLANGSGDSMFERAKVFAKLGYKTAIFKDSDKDAQLQDAIEDAKQHNIDIFDWGSGNSLEEAIFSNCPDHMVPLLLDYAQTNNNADALDDHLMNVSDKQVNLKIAYQSIDTPTRSVIARAAKKYGWYKDIEHYENISKDYLAPGNPDFGDDFKNTVFTLWEWAKS